MNCFFIVLVSGAMYSKYKPRKYCLIEYRDWGHMLTTLIFIVLAVVGFIVVWYVNGRLSLNTEGKDSKSNMVVLLGESNSALSVLPFETLSDDVEDNFLSSGITLDVISIVSKIPKLRVSSRLSSFRYKQGQVDIKKISKQLNTQYVLTGSVQRLEDDIIVVARLVDVQDGSRVWLQTYRRQIDDLFDIENDIAECIVGAILGQVKLSNAMLARSLPNMKLDAWGLEQKAYHFWLTSFTLEGILEACNYLRQAIELEPQAASSKAALSMLLVQQLTARTCDDYKSCANEARVLIQEACELAPDDIDVLENAGVVWQNLGEPELANKALRKAINLAPFNLITRGYLALLLAFTGSEDDLLEAQQIIDENFATAPNHPSTAYWNFFLAILEQRLGNHTKAAELAQKSLDDQPFWPHNYFIIANSFCVDGDFDSALGLLEKAKAVNPYLNAELYIDNVRTIVGDDEIAINFVYGLKRLIAVQTSAE